MSRDFYTDIQVTFTIFIVIFILLS